MTIHWTDCAQLTARLLSHCFTSRLHSGEFLLDTWRKFVTLPRWTVFLWRKSPPNTKTFHPNGLMSFITYLSAGLWCKNRTFLSCQQQCFPHFLRKMWRNFHVWSWCLNRVHRNFTSGVTCMTTFQQISSSPGAYRRFQHLPSQRSFQYLSSSSETFWLRYVLPRFPGPSRNVVRLLHC